MVIRGTQYDVTSDFHSNFDLIFLFYFYEWHNQIKLHSKPNDKFKRDFNKLDWDLRVSSRTLSHVHRPALAI